MSVYVSVVCIDLQRKLTLNTRGASVHRVDLEVSDVMSDFVLQYFFGVRCTKRMCGIGIIRNVSVYFHVYVFQWWLLSFITVCIRHG